MCRPGVLTWSFSGSTSGKRTCLQMQVDIRDMGSIPTLRRSPGVGHGNLLQYSCLQNPMDREPGGPPFLGSQRIRHDWSDLACTHIQCWDSPSAHHHHQRQAQQLWPPGPASSELEESGHCVDFWNLELSLYLREKQREAQKTSYP